MRDDAEFRMVLSAALIAAALLIVYNVLTAPNLDISDDDFSSIPAEESAVNIGEDGSVSTTAPVDTNTPDI